ncbi:MAG: AMP-dependent synthetase, partial [Proteobacteria bacterium]|nr:AMP-dependent synthetase [Pseudomonadota bacterium]
MTAFTTLKEMLVTGADAATAIAAPGVPGLTYAALRKLVANTIAAYNALGVGRNDRIGIVLANGPEMATAFIAVAAGATAAPLNPGYRADEFEFYLSDLNAKALIVAQGSDSPAVGVARKLNVPIIELIAHPELGAGSFELKAAAPAGAAANPGYAAADDVALVLHTSGTTSRPKIVPLSQRNVCASARNVRDTLALTAQDRGLNIMPLFHIHGLIAGVLAPLSAGG